VTTKRTEISPWTGKHQLRRHNNLARLKKGKVNNQKYPQKSGGKTYRAAFTTTPLMRNPMNGFLRRLIYLISERSEITKLIHKFCVLLRAHNTTNAFSVIDEGFCVIQSYILWCTVALHAKFCRGGRRLYWSSVHGLATHLRM
jgi:hypothetical protein